VSALAYVLIIAAWTLSALETETVPIPYDERALRRANEGEFGKLAFYR
jgi:hypothetical protein